MSQKSSKSKEAVFSQAVEISDPQERAAFLAQACGDNTLLRNEVEDLLRHERIMGEFLKTQTFGEDARSSIRHRKEESLAGSRIGPYHLLERIGLGGMGEVYLAEQKEPVRRRVALKIIKPGMDSKQVIARFEAERQALAIMDHPNIARVFDAGMTDQGQPYFVMELVDGLPITEYCDTRRQSVQQRLELFVDVCAAVQHAHQKGIIHRDLKPSNILVALYDGRAVPKVIDFGIAKATAQDLTDLTIFTQFGQIIGTLEYMSPEQSQRNQTDVDTRSDVYSLGVVLYELLAGKPPIDRQRLQAAGLDEILRIIREEEPPKPSTKVSTDDTLPSIAALRSVEPQKLSLLLKGELDWVLGKAIAKERERRYESALSFAQDIQRFLGDQPVLAVPPSQGYLIRKYAKRNWKFLATASVFLTLVLAAIFVSTSLSISRGIAIQKANASLEETRQLAEKNRLLAERVKKALVSSEAQRDRAQKQLSITEANQLAFEARKLIETDHNKALQLAVESVQRTEATGADTTLASHQILRDLLAYRGSHLWVVDSGLMTVQVLQVSPNSEWVAVGLRNGDIKLRACDPNQSDVITLRAHDGRVTKLAFSPDGRWLASGGGSQLDYVIDAKVRLWDLANLHLDPEILGNHFDYVTKLQFSPDSRWLVSECTTETKVWDISAKRDSPGRLVLSGGKGGSQFSNDQRWWFGLDQWWDLNRQAPFEQPASAPEEDLDAMFLPTNGSESIELVMNEGRVIFRDAKAEAKPKASQLTWLVNLFHQYPGDAITWATHKISANGEWLLFAGGRKDSHDNETTIWLWHLASNMPIQVPTHLTLPTSKFHSAAFSPDGTWLVAAGDQSLAWNLRQANPAATPVRLPGADRVAFSSNGQWLFTWSASTVQTWTMQPDGPGRTTVPCMMDPARGYDVTHPYYRWPVQRDGVPRDLAASGPPLALSSSGKFLVTGNEDTVARLWNLENVEEIPDPILLEGHNRKVHSVAISNDDRWIAAGSYNTTRVWDLANQSPEIRCVELSGHKMPLRELQFDSQNRYLFGLSYGKVLLWQLPILPEAKPLELLHDNSLRTIDIDAKSLLAVTAGLDSAPKIWRIDQPNFYEAPIDLPQPKGQIGIARLSPDGRWLLTSGTSLDDWKADTVLWDLRSENPEDSGLRLSNPVEVRNAAFSKDGRFLAVSSRSGDYIYDLLKDDPILNPDLIGLREPFLLQTVVNFSPDGRFLALGALNSLGIWQRNKDDDWLRIHNIRNAVGFAEFSPDGRWLATGEQNPGSQTCQVSLWRITNQVQIETPVRLASSIHTPVDARFSPDGRWLCVVDETGRVSLWPHQLDDLLNLATRRIGKHISETDPSPLEKELMKTGWDYYFDPTGRLRNVTVALGQELRRLSAIAGFNSLRSLRLSGVTAQSDLDLVPQLQNLELLRIDQFSQGSISLEPLTDLPQLAELSLDASALNPQAASTISEITTLDVVALRSPNFSDQDWSQIASLPKLKYLSSIDGSISPAAFRDLSGHPRLTTLILQNMGVTDAHLSNVSDDSFIQHLSLEQAEITDDGIASLSQRLPLRTLDLTGCPVTDKVLADLLTIPTLRNLTLRDTQVSKETASRFRQENPHIRLMGP